jgi:hypothetical protein
MVVSLGSIKKFRLRVVDKNKKNMSKRVTIQWEKGEGGVDTKRKDKMDLGHEGFCF